MAGLLDRDFANLLARYDLPQPGGPYKSTPLRRSAPNSSSKAVGAHSGVQTRRRISSNADRMPPTSLTTASHRPGSKLRYWAAAFAADSRASKYLPLLFFSASMSLDRSLAFDRLRAACAEHHGLATRSEPPQNQKINHPRLPLPETIHEDGVEAPQHFKTPRSCLVHLRLLQLLRPVLFPLGVLLP